MSVIHVKIRRFYHLNDPFDINNLCNKNTIVIDVENVYMKKVLSFFLL